MEPARRRRRHRHPAAPPGRVVENRCILATAPFVSPPAHVSPADADRRFDGGTDMTSGALEQLAEEIRAEAWELAVEVVEEGRRGDQIPPLSRLGPVGQ